MRKRQWPFNLLLCMAGKTSPKGAACLANNKLKRKGYVLEFTTKVLAKRQWTLNSRLRIPFPFSQSSMKLFTGKTPRIKKKQTNQPDGGEKKRGCEIGRQRGNL